MLPLARHAGAALVIVGLCGSAGAQGLKPHVVLVLDTSGPMYAPTGAGQPSCAGATRDTRLDHARCAVNHIANDYGDIVFALGRFRETAGGTFATTCDTDRSPLSANDCTSSGISCAACDCDGAAGPCAATCTPAMRSDARLEMLTGLVDGGSADAATWTDFGCGTCGSGLAQDPEIWGAGSWTPLGGALLGVRRYWQGLQATDGSIIWPGAAPGFDPIASDPLSGCRPYLTILLTHGGETCGGDAPAAAAALLSTPVGASSYRIETRVIGIGITGPDPTIEAIAHAGGAVDLPAADEGYYVQGEDGVALAIAGILAGAIRAEVCNGLDDDCDTAIDEDFAQNGQACDDGGIGACRGTGTRVCRADRTGTRCEITAPGQTPVAEVCNAADDDCDTRIDEGVSACTGPVGPDAAGGTTDGGGCGCRASGGAADGLVVVLAGVMARRRRRRS